MADLTRTWRWEKYIPDIGENRTLKAPFYLRVKSGVTVMEFEAFREKLKAFSATSQAVDDVVHLFEEFVELGDEPLTFAGREVKTLVDYIEVLSSAMRGGAVAFSELIETVLWHNSVDGVRALFYARLSGGTVFTR